MIKKYNQFINESLLDELIGPTEEELWNNIKKLSPKNILIKSAKSGFLKGIKHALELGANIHADDDLALKNAAYFGHLDVVDYLVEHGADINADDVYSLSYAVINNHLNIVKYLVEHGANIHAQNDDALTHATYNGHLDIVKYLVEQGADIHSKYDFALRCAVERGYLDIVTYLVEHGANIHKHGEFILKLAVENGHVDVAEYIEEQIKKEKLTESLLDYLKGPSEEELWNTLKNLTPNEMLVKTAELGLLKGVKHALELGADINADDVYSLSYAVINNHLNIVKYLVEHGANIHAQNDDALTYATYNGHLDIVKYLVEQGADIHSKYDFALRCAVERGYLDIVTYLVEHGANIHKHGEFILKLAVENGHLNVVKYLEEQIKKEKLTESLLDYLKGPSEEELWNTLKNLTPNEMLVKTAELGLLKGVKHALELGADIHVNDDAALRYSALYGHLDLVKYLVELGADIHANNDFALRNAALYGHLDVVKYLVEHGADIHKKYDKALRRAAQKGHLDVVKYLVEHGADIHAFNDEALKFATFYRHLNVVKYLEEQIKKEKLTEGLTDYMKGPSEEEVKNAINDGFKNGTVDLAKYIKQCEEYNLELPTIKEIKRNYKYIMYQDVLHNAILLNSRKGVDIALEFGADIDFLTTPLFYAIYFKKYNMLKYLVEKGANVNAMNGKPLLYAIKQGTINDVKYLLQHGADVHANNDAALFYTENSGKDNLYNIIKNYADKTKPLSEEERYKTGGYDKMKPEQLLRYASEYGLLSGVKKAFDSGVYFNERDIMSAFNLACSSNNTDVIKYFILEKGLDVNKLHKNVIESIFQYGSSEIKELVKSKLNKDDKEI